MDPMLVGLPPDLLPNPQNSNRSAHIVSKPSQISKPAQISRPALISKPAQLNETGAASSEEPTPATPTPAAASSAPVASAMVCDGR